MYTGEPRELANTCESHLGNLTLKESLNNQLNRAKAEVARLDEVIQLLDKNPEVQRIMELLGSKMY